MFKGLKHIFKHSMQHGLWGLAAMAVVGAAVAGIVAAALPGATTLVALGHFVGLGGLTVSHALGALAIAKATAIGAGIAAGAGAVHGMFAGGFKALKEAIFDRNKPEPALATMQQEPGVSIAQELQVGGLSAEARRQAQWATLNLKGVSSLPPAPEEVGAMRWADRSDLVSAGRGSRE